MLAYQVLFSVQHAIIITIGLLETRLQEQIAVECGKWDGGGGAGRAKVKGYLDGLDGHEVLHAGKLLHKLVEIDGLCVSASSGVGEREVYQEKH